MMKGNLKHLVMFVLVFFFSFSLFAQERSISGTVVSADDGMPVPMADIIVKNKPGKGTAANFDGDFTLYVENGDVLEVSSVGMKTATVKIVPGKSTYNISLGMEAAVLGELIITGFDNVDERLFTGANNSIKAEDLKVDGVVDVSRMLEGKAAGVNIQNVTGTFGAAPKITIRGASSIFGDTKPLFVIDGVVQEDIVNLSFEDLTSGDANTLIGSSIAGLNANDIKGIEILKDAAATALYGARALNGVVVINTKSGKRETPTTINYTLEQTVRTRPTYAQYDILDSRSTMTILQELENKGFLTQAGVVQGRNGGVYYGMYEKINTYDPKTGQFLLTNTPEARNKYLQQYELANTDWFKVLFKTPSITQNHSLSFSGGGKSNSYYASLSYYADEGWTIADKVNRLTTNFKNTFYLSDKFTLTLMGKASVRNQNAPGTYSQKTDPVKGGASRDFDINPFSYALNTNRTIRPYDQKGQLEYVWNNWADFNIIDELKNNYIDLDVKDYLFQVDGSYKITDDLTYGVMASGRYVTSISEHNITENSNVAKAYRSDATTIIRDNNIYLYKDPTEETAIPRVVLPYGGIYRRSTNTLESYYLRNTLNYAKSFQDRLHEINVFLGQDLRDVQRRASTTTAYGIQYGRGYQPFTLPGIFQKTLLEGSDYFSLSDENERTVSLFGKATYAYNRKYVVAATGRYDGSNRQGLDATSRWTPTWSLSGKWVASEEDFIKNSDFINTLQIRPSYGLTATTSIATNSLPIIRSMLTDRLLVGDRENALVIVENGNRGLTWEKQYEANLGVDLGFVDNRIQLNFDIYQRNGFDLIDYIKTSGEHGEVIQLANNADMITKGLEVSLNTVNIKTEDFKWSTAVNFSTFAQEVTKLQSEPNAFGLVRSTGGNVIGYPRNSLFSFDFQGLDFRGLPTFKLPDGEDSVTGVDFQATQGILDYLVYEGPTEPNTTISLNNTFDYKNWSLGIFISSSWGNKVRLNPIYGSQYSDLSVFTKDFENRWILPGDEKVTDIPVIASRRLITQNAGIERAYNAYNYSTKRIADGGFIRMKNISLAYNFPKEDAAKLGLKTLSLKAMATNPFLIYSDSRLNGQDPEFFQTGGVAYPIASQYTLTLMLSI